MESLELQQLQISQGALPLRKTVKDRRGGDYTQTETTKDVYSVLTLAQGKALAGYAFLKWRDDTIDIRDLHVTSRFRGRGLGDVLLQRIVLWAGTGGKSKVWGGIVQKDMHESPFLLEWYQRRGFTVEAPEDRNFLAVENEHPVWLDVADWREAEVPEGAVAEQPVAGDVQRPERQQSVSASPSPSGKRKPGPGYKYPFGRD